jgi:hypothetical protein
MAYEGVSKSFRTETITHSLRSNTKGYGDKTYYTDSQNRDTTAPSDRELIPLAFLASGCQSENFWIHPRIHSPVLSGTSDL